MTVVLSIWGLHHNPAVWENPQVWSSQFFRFPFNAFCWSNPTGNPVGQIGAQSKVEKEEKGSEEAERRFVAHQSLLKL